MEIGVRRAEAARRRKSAGGDPQGEGAPLPRSGTKLRPPGRLASSISCIGKLPAPGNPRGLNPPLTGILVFTAQEGSS